MNSDLEDIADAVAENYDFGRKTIGVDVGLNQIIEAAFRELVDAELDDVESELERFQGKRYTTLGKADFLKELEKAVGDASE